MPTEDSNESIPYFDTPERAERLQLIAHMLDNTEEVPYLRAPQGSGKTRAAKRLAQQLSESYQIIWLHAARTPNLRDAVCAALQLNPEKVRWPVGIAEAAGDRALLLIVDGADAIDLATLSELFSLHAQGVRLLMLGNGDLAKAKGNWNFQFVDFPAFTEAQSLGFLQHLNPTVDIDENKAAELHRECFGMPGALLLALKPKQREAAIAAHTPAEAQSRSGVRLPIWLGGLALVGLVGAAVVFQETINALFEPSQQASDPSVIALPGQTVNVPAPEVAGESEPVFEPSLMSTRSSPSLPAPDTTLLPLPEPNAEPEQGPEPDSALPESASVDASGSNKPNSDAVVGTVVEALGAPAIELPLSTSATSALQPQPVMTRTAPVSPIESITEAPKESLSELAGGEPAESVAEPVSIEPPTEQVAKVTESVAAVITEAKPQASPESSSKAGPTPGSVTSPAPDPVLDAVIEAAIAAAAQTPEQSGTDATAPREAVAIGDQREVEQAPITVEPAPKPVVEAPAISSPPVAGGADKDQTWLRAQPAEHYTLQLLGARDRAAVLRFIREKGVPAPYAVFARDLQGAPWYSLVQGAYPSRDAALAGRAKLPGTLAQSGAWPRTFASIQEQLP